MDRRAFNQAIEAAETRSLSAASVVEVSIVIESRYGPEGIRDLDLFLSKAEIDLVAVDSDQALLARQALRHYGKGRHPAALDLGDCFSYALAKSLGEPLLFKGQDFASKDLSSVNV